MKYYNIFIILISACFMQNSLYGYTDASPEWQMATRLYADEKAHSVGDLITVIVEEKSSLSRSAQNQSTKSTTGGGNMSVASPYYTTAEGEQRGAPWQSATLPAFNWQFGHNQSGGGETTSEDDLSSTLTARVLDVLPNGNLLLEGRRVVQLEEERVEVVLTGIVRTRDISAANTVSSSRLGDASIRYVSKGPLRREHRRGLFTRLWNWVNPF